MKQLLDKIEAIRREPEHIRMRYVFLSVAVSMAFVLLLWIFSVYEGFRSAATASPTLPPGMNLPKAPTLDDFSKKSDTQKTTTGQEFFQSEQTKRSNGSGAVEQ